MEYVCQGYILNFKVLLLGGICAEIWGVVLLKLSTYDNVAHVETFVEFYASNFGHQFVRVSIHPHTSLFSHHFIAVFSPIS